MKLEINGKTLNFSENISIADILENLQVRNKVMATAVNMEIVKEQDWEIFQPKDGDKIEFLQFVGGG
jgi:sulfur carrier protein